MSDAFRRSRTRRRDGGASTPTTPRHRIPDLSPLPQLLARTGELESLVERYHLAAGGRAGSDLRHVTYAAIPHGAKTYLAAALAQASAERLVWIARDAEIADRVAEELAAWLGGSEHVVTLEPRTALAYERSELVRDESAARVAALAAWRREGSPARILVTSVQALFQRTLAPDDLPTAPLTLQRGLRRGPDARCQALVTLGYEHVPEVGGRGEFARRGGIVDVFPAGQPMPVRVEWFGDEIDSMRAFDPADQRGRARSMRPSCCRRPSSSWGRTCATCWSSAWLARWPACQRACRRTSSASARARWVMPPSCGVATSRRTPPSTTWGRPSGSSTSQTT